MGKIRRILFHLISLSICFLAAAQERDSIMDRLLMYAYTIDNFTKNIPHEKVYLHFDNTSYYQGDNIWFKGYVVTSGFNRASQLSKTLYVELLNPGGEVLGKKTLRIENGQCHGHFSITHLPFYSGFYEIRAYTKYMLNFGEDVIFSRVFPVFDSPKEEGNFEEKKMLRYGLGKYPQKRNRPRKEKRVNMKFYPEGGNLVQGIESVVAFEATDANGLPIDITGIIVNENKEEVARLAVLHDGRGVFNYRPTGTGKKHRAVINHEGKSYPFDMPEALPEGIVLSVDNLSSPDSIGITIQKRETSPCVLGLALHNGAKLYDFCLIDSEDEFIPFKLGKNKLPPGVSRLVLFEETGKIVSDRLIFINQNEMLEITARTDKMTYNPYEPVTIDFSITGKEECPVPVPFSVSVRDATDEVASDHSIQTNLLLQSEIKGYIHNPSYYFESDDRLHREALDQLLMVQGWRRYSWDILTGRTPFALRFRPEQGIEIQGEVVTMVRKKRRPDVDVSFLLQKRGEDEESASYLDVFRTDSLGRFSFVTNAEGKWNMILSVMEKGKRKDHRIILDRIFSPEPKTYKYADMQVKLEEQEEPADPEMPVPEEDIDSFLTAYTDSLTKAGMDEKIHRLDEVKVTAKKRSRESDIYNNRSKSIAYYDVASEIDDIRDRGEYIGGDIHTLLLNLNNHFAKRIIQNEEYVHYKSKLPLFVINYERREHTKINYDMYKGLNLEAIKSIYINENLSIMCQYADPRMSPMDVDKIFGCAVFIETHPEGMIPASPGKGVRKTWLEGYSEVQEFYSPDYSLLPPEPDYRRTLYWNPNVIPGDDGKVKIQFYNNSRARSFKISAETVTSQGIIGMYRD